MTNIARASGAQFLFPENNEASIVTRLALYAEHNGNRPPDCFVNIGGAVPNMGNTNASLKFPNGLVTQMPLQTEHPERGV